MAITRYGKTLEYDKQLVKELKSANDIWGVKSIDSTGIFELNDGKYSKCFILSDINFAGVTDGEQKDIIINFSKVLNTMPCRFSYTVANEHVADHAFNDRVLYKGKGDSLDGLRDAYNDVIRDKLSNAKQGLYQTIYLTLTIESDSIFDARVMFSSLEASLRSAFIQIGINGMAGSRMDPVDINRRMQLWYNFTHDGLGSGYHFDFKSEIESCRDWTNTISPLSVEFFNDYFVFNGIRYGRVMYISDYSKALDSDILSSLSEMNCTSYISVNSELLDAEGLEQEIRMKHAMVGFKIENEKQRLRKKNDFLTEVNSRLSTENGLLENFMKQVGDTDDRFFNSTVLVMFMADSKEKLDEITEKIKAAAAIKSLEIKTCFAMQREGLNSTFMFGIQEFKRCCNFTAPCLAMFMPFKTQEINDEGGIYMGINQLSQNAIIANRKKLDNKAGLLLGMSRSGKSVYAKSEIISTVLNNPDDQIIVIDPQCEYGFLSDVVGGSRISFSSQKEVYVNPLDVDFKDVDYAQLQEIISEKTDFIFTLLSSCMKRDIGADEQGVLGDVIKKVYSENYAIRKKINGESAHRTEFDEDVPGYMRIQKNSSAMRSDLTNEEQIRTYSPTLQDIYQGLLDEDNVMATNIAAYMQVFVNGALDLFNHRTNVDTDNKFLVFDISGIKKSLRVPAMLVMLELVHDKIRSNFLEGAWTYLYIDEFHELLGIPVVADFVVKLWKEVGKLKGILTGITQNMTDLHSKAADADRLAAILSNTAYFAMFNQSTIDRNLLMEFLPSVSPAMFNFVEGAPAGTGLLKMGNITIPFDIRMDRESKIFKIVNTDGSNAEAAI